LASWKKLHRMHICADRTTWHRATIGLLRASPVFPARACFLRAKKSAVVTTDCRQVRSLSTKPFTLPSRVEVCHGSLFPSIAATSMFGPAEGAI
jgi:hypothetical protein